MKRLIIKNTNSFLHSFTSHRIPLSGMLSVSWITVFHIINYIPTLPFLDLSFLEVFN